MKSIGVLIDLLNLSCFLILVYQFKDSYVIQGECVNGDDIEFYIG